MRSSSDPLHFCGTTTGNSKLAIRWLNKKPSKFYHNLSFSTLSSSLSNVQNPFLFSFSQFINHSNPHISLFPRKGFSEITDPLIAKAIHGFSLRYCLPLTPFQCNTLITFYFRLGNPKAALYLFEQMPERNDTSWNTTISGCANVGLFNKTIQLFKNMREENIELNGFVISSLLTLYDKWGNGIAEGTAIHALVSKLGLMCNVYVSTALLHLYGSHHGSLSRTRKLFDDMPERNVVSWTTFIASLCLNGHPLEALEAYKSVRWEGIALNPNVFATAINACRLLESEIMSLQVIGHAVVSGFQKYTSVSNSIISLFGVLGRIGDAAKVFDRMEIRDTISWNSIISLNAHENSYLEAFKLFSEMRGNRFKPDATTISSLVSVCASIDHIKWGKGLHSLCTKNGLNNFASVNNAFINLYSTAAEFNNAKFLFDKMPERDIISSNTLISSYARHGRWVDALLMLNQLIRTKEWPNSTTFVSLLAACIGPETIIHGRMVHALITQLGLQNNLPVGNALITMYGKCSRLEEAQFVFRAMPVQDVITCNAIIGCHVENESTEEAIEVFCSMRENSIKANYITLISLLGAFSCTRDLTNWGMPLHAYIISAGFESDNYVKNSLITMYAKCGDDKSSSFIFENMDIRSTVSWNTIISAKTLLGLGEDALRLFVKMAHSENKLDQFSISEGLAASSDLASLEEGQQIHGLSLKLGFASEVHVLNATMDMYSKCGKMEEMLQLMPGKETRPRQFWNILISSYGRHGHFNKAEESFKEMVLTGTKPDFVTFVAVLSACTHAGLVEKGLHYYNSMISEYGIIPGIKHCVCIVDSLGRVGRLNEAENFIEQMPVQPNELIWRSLLSCSRIHKNVEIGKRAADRLLELQPSDDSAFVLLSNLYASSGQWGEVAKLRRHMKAINLEKKPACSWIKFNNEISSFGIGDKSHERSKEIYVKLEELRQMVVQVGYVAETSFALHDMDEEQKEENLWSHSEKIALAYGLIRAPKGAVIRIFKNLRVCGDCHLVFKLVSQVTNREILLRDPYRFHCFKDGDCSCSDFW
ncbi:Pentatricopeptide repeat-containing protein [Rhynchospora pubera]|uniref:Pentatricopeptide repeat-containing protein n=1 Tax=Rhynchospora pubera TaxID=906938 RepID=A0AAV8DCR5_9POAL|nr:Pentatricopeptide repeat-containing protein [Rhynchospora pubera]